jgi:hypothetical protein
MALPVNARIDAVPNFAANLEQVRAFFVAQDAATAPARLIQLKGELRDMKRILSWSPAAGRPARFLNGNSVQAHMRTATVLQLAAQAGLPFLREYVVAQHVVLYAHSDAEVLLLALKHHRQLAYCTLQ